MKLPSLSVVMSNYNHGRYIKRALEAIVSQSVQPLEFIVIDDASADDSVVIIQEFADKYSFIRLIKNTKNIGGLNNVNNVLPFLKGDYFYSAAADDMILPGFFEKSLKLLAHYPEAGLSSTLTLVIDEKDNNKGLWPLPIISLRECYIGPEQARRFFYNNLPWMHGDSVIMKRNYVLELGGFKLEHHFLADAFIYHYLPFKYGACFVPEPLVAMRRLDGAYSDTRNKLELTRSYIDNFTKSMQEHPDVFSAKYAEKYRNIQMITCYRRRWLFVSNNLRVELSGLCKKGDLPELFLLTIFKAGLSCMSLLVSVYLSVVLHNAFFNFIRSKIRHYLMAPFISLNLPPCIKK